MKLKWGPPKVGELFNSNQLEQSNHLAKQQQQQGAGVVRLCCVPFANLIIIIMCKNAVPKSFC
jgi:hypothetical protein